MASPKKRIASKTTNKKKSVNKKKSKAKSPLSKKKRSTLNDAFDAIIKHPEIIGNNMTLHSASFIAGVEGRRCLEYENQRIITIDPVTHQRVVTIQAVCVRWAND